MERLIDNESQPIDLIFFTGDIAFRGGREEFTRATAILGRIRAANAALVSEAPLLLTPVPGNHDLTRRHSGRESRPNRDRPGCS